jgi:hypothetical protein
MVLRKQRGPSRRYGSSFPKPAIIMEALFMKNSRFLNLCSIICIALSVACSLPYRHPTVEPELAFNGIEALLGASQK